MRAIVSNRTLLVEKVPKVPVATVEKIEQFLTQATPNTAHSQEPRLDFEMGAGAGVFAIRYARENTTRHLISVEKTREKFDKFQSRLAHHEALPNLLALHANAISVLVHHVPDQAIDHFFLWYPNPFPAKARFVRTPFFECLLSKICKGGSFHFATNVREYFDEQRTFFGQRSDFVISQELEFDRTLSADFKPRTLFEKKYFLRNETLFELEVKKKLL